MVPSIYYELTSLQHRGQESCGIAVSNTKGEWGNVQFHKDLGLVSEVFKEENLHKMTGDLGLGHVRYSTTGASVAENVAGGLPLCKACFDGNYPMEIPE